MKNNSSWQTFNRQDKNAAGYGLRIVVEKIGLDRSVEEM
jgi:hypothetical protein